MPRKGLWIESLGNAVTEAVRPGERIVKVNGFPVEDELDYRFYAGAEGASVEVQGPEGRCRTVRLSGDGVRGLRFSPMRSKRCTNRCLFCFVDQMPDGLRPSLYVKDEDYRFSFLYGNYVTLASATDDDLDRICRLKLRPLYVSVHATDSEVRNLLLGRKKSRPILETLGVLAGCGITMHTQIVLCPGINDGAVLEKTVCELAGLYPAVASIAVVPVGLTRYRKVRGLRPLRGIRKNDAITIINKIRVLQNEFKLKYDDLLVFPSDEFYRRANRPFPPAEAYGGFPQWENGVGMVALFNRQWERRKRRGGLSRRTGGSGQCVILTGEAAYPVVLPYVEWLNRSARTSLRLVPVRNRFFGRSVSVTGLLTGRDVIEAMRSRVLHPGTTVLVPDVMLGREKDRFLDDVTIREIEETLSVPVIKFTPDPKGLERVLEKLHEGIVGKN
jgi:putative radical SAM enzyme (TIGR03279 family)